METLGNILSIEEVSDIRIVNSDAINGNVEE